MIFRPDSSQLKIAALSLSLGLAACGNPDAELAPVDRARAALATGEAMQAEVILHDQIAAGADKAELAAFLGEAEFQQGKLAEAGKWLREGDFSVATRSHGFHMLARLEMEEGNLPQAGKALDNALEDNPDSADIWVDIARLRYRGNEQAQAVEASIHAVELDPANARALQFRAQLVRESEGMLAALPWFERALEHNPENTDLLFDYAATLGELGLANEMLATVRQIALINPVDRRVYFLQAVLAARAGKFELAQTLLLRASKDIQERPAAMLLSGIIDMEIGNYASAAQILERLAAKQPKNRRVRQLLARTLYLGKNDSELIYRFAKEAALPSGSPYLRTLVGRAYEAIDEREKAAPFLDMAAMPRSGKLTNVGSGVTLDVAEARNSRSNFDALELVRARIESGNSRSALGAVRPYLDKFPGSANMLLLGGDAALAAQEYLNAVSLYQKAAAIRNPWTTARKLIIALDGAGRQNDALILLARYFTGDPANIEAAGLLARVAIENKDWQSAAIFLDRALAYGAYRDPVLLALRARVALEMGDVALAVETAEIAEGIQPLNPEAIQALALSYRASGTDEGKVKELETKLRRLTI